MSISLHVTAIYVRYPILNDTIAVRYELGALLQYCTELYYSTLTSTARPSFSGGCGIDQITLHFLARSFGMIDERGFQVNDEIDITTWRCFLEEVGGMDSVGGSVRH